jgi:hypothetical protein
MTARDELRDVARFLDEGLSRVPGLAEGLPEFVRLKAERLRTLARRIDEEEKSASDDYETAKTWQSDAAATARTALLARLDADLEGDAR